MKKMLLCGVLAAVVMFFWSFIAHDVLPTGEAGLSTTTNEDAVLANLKSQLGPSGFYFLPGQDMVNARTGSKDQQKAAMEAWTKKLAAGPRALIIYHPTGSPGIDPKMLLNEFLSDVVAGLIMAWMFVLALPNLSGFGIRVLYVGLLGVLAWVVVDFSYWNWFEFPTAYALAQMADYVVGAFLAGVVLAWLYRKHGTTLSGTARAA
jgi:hypothetical protein